MYPNYFQNQASPYNQFSLPQTARQEVVRVNGENGARAYSMGANSSALLLDESGIMIWLVTTDGAGYKTVSAYDIVPHQIEQVPDYSKLENRIAKLEEFINGFTTDTSTAERNSSATSSVDTTAECKPNPKFNERR